MAKQIEGVYEKVYECAKKEFLSKGFKDAPFVTSPRRLVPAQVPFIHVFIAKKGCSMPSFIQ